MAEDYKVALFLCSIGTEATKTFNTFDLTTENKIKLSAIIEAFDKFAIGEKNETYERYKFNSMDQLQNESIPAYITDLHTLAQTCNFCTCLNDSLIRDRIVLGIRVQKTANSFSAIPLDQAHDQNNELIKGDGGAIGLTENPSALLRWMVAGPELARERLIDRSKPLQDSIPRNNLSLWTPSSKTEMSKDKMTSSRTDCQLFSRLYIGCHRQEGNLDEFFSHENQGAPPSLSDGGRIRQDSKSDFEIEIPCMEKMIDRNIR
ncbi:hypothetical protein QZH41_001584 [Actinostola sp. cb2023]|nr:hypothetical protein QZH41_001584 [Actinostola sp. cb2023]